MVGALGIVVAFGSWLGPTIPDALAAPVLEVDPRSGVVGTTVSIAGRGFCGSPGCSSVQISFDGIVLAGGVGVAPDGSFSRTLTVPGGTTPGEKAVSATQTNASGQGQMAVATFQVTLGGPAATASPTTTTTATGTATPTVTESPPTMPPSSAPPVIAPPASGDGGSTTGLTLAMVVAAAVFVTSLLGMGYVLLRSREFAEPHPPPVGLIAPPEPSPQPPEPSPGPPQSFHPTHGPGDGQTTG